MDIRPSLEASVIYKVLCVFMVRLSLESSMRRAWGFVILVHGDAK